MYTVQELWEMALDDISFCTILRELVMSDALFCGPPAWLDCLGRRKSMYLLTEWEGRTGKYLAQGQDVRVPYILTERQIFSLPTRPYSVK